MSEAPAPRGRWGLPGQPQERQALGTWPEGRSGASGDGRFLKPLKTLEEVSQLPSSRLGSRFASAAKEFLTGSQFTSCYTYFCLNRASRIGWILFI